VQYLGNLRYNVNMTVKNKPIDTDALPNTKVLKNGAVYDMDKGRIVANPRGGTQAITSANARDMQRLAVEKKRSVMNQAANRDVSPALRAEYGEYAHVAERAIVLQQIATTPEAGKAAVMAHQALTNDTGMGEGKAIAETQQTVTHTLDPEVIALLQQIAHAQGQEPAIDAVVLDDE
jgi:hypothetical protein